MALESLNGTDKFFDDLNISNPAATDVKNQGDDHLRGIKNVIRNTLPNLSSEASMSSLDLNFLKGLGAQGVTNKLISGDKNSHAFALSTGSGLSVNASAGHAIVALDKLVGEQSLGVSVNFGVLVGIGSASPGAPLHITSPLGGAGNEIAIIESTATGAGPTPIVKLHANSASPAVNDFGGWLQFVGENDASAEVIYGGILMQIMDETATSENGEIEFQTYQDGSRDTVLSMRQGVVVGGSVSGEPTGGDKGQGTINAKAIYDDNVLLSCYPIDQYLDNDVDLAKWDSMTPNGRHEPARRFKQRSLDDLDIDAYARFWQANRHLPSFPSEEGFNPSRDTLPAGDWIQRLIETVEVQAIHIHKLSQRISALEKQAPPGTEPASSEE